MLGFFFFFFSFLIFLLHLSESFSKYIFQFFSCILKFQESYFICPNWLLSQLHVCIYFSYCLSLQEDHLSSQMQSLSPLSEARAVPLPGGLRGPHCAPLASCDPFYPRTYIIYSLISFMSSPLCLFLFLTKNTLSLGTVTVCFLICLKWYQTLLSYSGHL